MNLDGKVVFSLERQRIGDCIAAQGIIARFRAEHPKAYIYLISDKSRNVISLPLLYGRTVDRIVDVGETARYARIRQDRSIARLGFIKGFIPKPAGCGRQCPANPWGDGKCYGNLWITSQHYAKTFFLPAVSLPCTGAVRKRIPFTGDLRKYKKVVIHILEDAAYDKVRNHRFVDFEELCRLLVTRHKDLLIIRVGRDMGNRLPSFDGRVIDVTGQGFTIEETARVVSLADVYIGGDTGITHIAGAVGVPYLVAVYSRVKYDTCRRRMGMSEYWSTFPLVPPWRISRVLMRNHRFSRGAVVSLVRARLYPSLRRRS
jgi:hypothetical protein